MTAQAQLSGKVGDALRAALALTGNIETAEAAVLNAIAALTDTPNVDNLLPETAKCALAQESELRSRPDRGSMLPHELQRLFHFAPIHRYSIVLRVLLGLTPTCCAEILNLSLQELDHLLQTALPMLVVVELEDEPQAITRKSLTGKYSRTANGD